MGSFGRYIAILIAVILVVLLPLQYIAQAESETVDSIVHTHVEEFTDRARNQGYITHGMYENLVDKLDKTGEIYNVSLEVAHPVTGKELSDAGAGEDIPDVSAVNMSLRIQTSICECISGNICTCADCSCKECGCDVCIGKKGALSFLSITKENIFASSFSGRITLFAAHTHSAACYPGTLHVCDGISCAYTGGYSIAVIAASNGLYYSNDGITWTNSGITEYIKEVTYGKGMFVALGNRRIYTSTDGKNWVGSGYMYADMTDVAYGNGVFLGAGRDHQYAQYNMWYSLDGINWNIVYPNGNGSTTTDYFMDIKYVNDEYKKFMVLNPPYTTIRWYTFDGIKISEQNVQSPLGYSVTNSLYSVNKNVFFYANGNPIMTGLSGSTIDYYFQTGLASTSDGIAGYGNGKYIDISGTNVYTAIPQSSSAANVWSRVGTFPLAYPKSIIYYGNKFIAAGFNYVPGTQNWGICTSADGITWTQNNVIYAVNDIACNADGGSGIPYSGTCTKIGKYYNGSTEVQPICNTVVTSIAATNPSQTVYRGANIITTATANMLDGTTKTISCTSNYNSSIVGTQTVTLTYSGLVGNALTTGTRTCTVTATVKDYVTAITATSPVQTINSGGSIIATANITKASGGTSAVACTVSNFNNTTIGTQTATLTYTGLTKIDGAYPTCTVTVTVNANEYVTSIVATSPIQSVYYGDSIVATATITKNTGSTQVVTCTVSGFNSTLLGAQTVTLTYSTGLKTSTGTNPTCTLSVTVKDYVTSIVATSPTQTIYAGGSIISTAIITKASTGTVSSTVSCTVTGFNNAVSGTQTVTLRYTGLTNYSGNNPICITTVTVKPNVTGLSVTPASQTIERYVTPGFTVTATYSDLSSKIVTGYTMTGFNKASIGIQTVTISYTENGITKTATTLVTVTKLMTTCNICGTVYELDTSDKDNGCPVCGAIVTSIIVSPSRVVIQKGEVLPITVTAKYRNGMSKVVTNWTCNYNPLYFGTQQAIVSCLGNQAPLTVEIIFPQKACSICGRSYSLNADGTDGGCPYCQTEVLSIHVLEDAVSVEKNESFSITVTGLFKDGHTEVITDWATDLLTNIAGTFTANIYYQNAVDTVMVTIIGDDLITCPYCGLSYPFNESPSGCPVCHTTIVSIETTLRNGGTQVLYCSSLNLQIALIYKDTHRASTYIGYSVSGYNANKLGIQTVTVSYNTLQTLLTIEVIKNMSMVTCPSGHVYYLNEDGTDPGCPICSNVSVTEDSTFYFDVTYNTDVVESLYTNGKYDLQKGDYLTVSVSVRGTSLMSKLSGWFFHNNMEARKQQYTYGGEVMS